jgi:antitoxin component YwqK of YwqJK toxin-antitoxin module
MHVRFPAFLPVFGLLVLFAGKAATAQAGTASSDTLNRLDEQGRKQGWWRITAPVDRKPGYDTGAVVEEGCYRNDRRTGTWKGYWPNGRVKSKITYAGGLPQGAYSLYYENGQIEEQGTWDLDRNTGAFKRWHANGKLAQEFLFDQFGTRNGEQKYYHENGQLAVDVTIKDGREEGSLKRYFSNGELQETAQFTAGDATPGSFRTYQSREPGPNPAPPGEASPGKTSNLNTNSAEFRANGWNTLYDGQHRLAQQGQYRNGQLLHGKVYKYDRNGILRRIQVYSNGRYIGNAQLTEDDK